MGIDEVGVILRLGASRPLMEPLSRLFIDQPLPTGFGVYLVEVEAFSVSFQPYSFYN